VFRLPGCYLCVFTVRAVEKEGMWLPFFHRNLDYLETVGYHFGDFFSGGGVVGPGMVTLHPVGLPHGPKPRALQSWLDGTAGAIHNEVAVMADFATPTRVSEWALGLRRADYMDTWGAYTTEPRFTWRADRLDEVRRTAERLGDARDTLRPPDGE
jgi:homogentisate 1,2-dioxygenase